MAVAGMKETWDDVSQSAATSSLSHRQHTGHIVHPVSPLPAAIPSMLQLSCLQVIKDPFIPSLAATFCNLHDCSIMLASGTFHGRGMLFFRRQRCLSMVSILLSESLPISFRISLGLPTWCTRPTMSAGLREDRSWAPGGDSGAAPSGSQVC